MRHGHPPRLRWSGRPRGPRRPDPPYSSYSQGQLLRTAASNVRATQSRQRGTTVRSEGCGRTHFQRERGIVAGSGTRRGRLAGLAHGGHHLPDGSCNGEGLTNQTRALHHQGPSRSPAGDEVDRGVQPRPAAFLGRDALPVTYEIALRVLTGAMLARRPRRRCRCGPRRPLAVLGPEAAA